MFISRLVRFLIKESDLIKDAKHLLADEDEDCNTALHHAAMSGFVDN